MCHLTKNKKEIQKEFFIQKLIIFKEFLKVQFHLLEVKSETKDKILIFDIKKIHTKNKLAELNQAMKFL